MESSDAHGKVERRRQYFSSSPRHTFVTAHNRLLLRDRFSQRFEFGKPLPDAPFKIYFTW